MSFLAEVIQNAERVELQTLTEMVPVTVQKVEKLREEVMQFLHNVYVFSSRPQENNLLDRSRSLCHQITDLENKVKSMNQTVITEEAEQINEYSEELIRHAIEANIISNILKVHDCLLKVHDLQAEKLYVQAMQEFIDIRKFMEGIPEDEVTEALLELKMTINTKSMALQSKLNNICLESIIFSEKSNDKYTTYSLKLRTRNDEFNDVFVALSLHDSTVAPLNKFGNALINNIFTPIINTKTDVRREKEDKFETLYVEVLNDKGSDHYKEVFNNIQVVLSFLKDNFDYQLSGENCTLTYVGNNIHETLSDLIIRNCLSATIPSTKEGLSRYSEVISDVDDLQKALFESKFVSEGTTLLLDYANNVDVLFINKKCSTYLEKAKALMRKDLHDIVEVGTPYDINNPLKDLDSNEFPQCSVSTSTIELLKLAEEIMDTAIAGSDVSAGRLFCTVENIFNLYADTVAEHHQKLLQTIPQQVAIYYNNCMYIVHTLCCWNETYKNKLSSTVNKGPVLFSDLLRLLKDKAESTFNAYVDGQIKQVDEIMRDARLSDSKSLDELDANTEKCIRQCMRQNELLKTVWQKVLPYSIYNKTLGKILNQICEYVINAIVGIEDIASSVAEQLVDVLKVILTRGPKLFTDPNEINLYVELWSKFKELILILNSSLMNIHDRWADGKGPLALVFAPNDVKNMIRALFQNTDERAAVLSKIC